MDNNLIGDGITPVKISEYEVGWEIGDVIQVLDYLSAEKRIVLGGDILTMGLDYTYDNWYYEPHPEQTLDSNSEASCEEAKRYIQNYIKRNGSMYYVVLVAR